ncbi:hypothetical protein D3C80_1543640 [compost metagenome]
MAQKDEPARAAEQVRSLHECRLSGLDDLRTRDAGKDRYGGDAGGDGGIDGLETYGGDHDHRQQKLWNCQEHIDQPGKCDIDPAAEKARKKPDETAGEDADDDSDECAGDGRGRAINDACVDIAAEVVGAEPVCETWAEQFVRRHPDDRAVTGKQAGRQ